MTTKLVLLAIGCFVLSASAAPAKEVRVIGGRYASAALYPYHVVILKGEDIQCGGSIIAPALILTAAHCIYEFDTKEMVVTAGITNLVADNGVSKTIKKSLCHENYKQTSNRYDFDIALLWLTEPFTYSNLISAIALPSASQPSVTGAANLTGFGITGPNDGVIPYLQTATLNIQSDTICSEREQYFTRRMICAARNENPNPFPGYTLNIEPYTALCSQSEQHFTRRQICADKYVKPYSFPGDSGGPLAQDGVLVGVVSRGWGSGSDDPSFYANVIALRPWIQQHSGV